jgi:small conductance mechanosensitive channel
MFASAFARIFLLVLCGLLCPVAMPALPVDAQTIRDTPATTAADNAATPDSRCDAGHPGACLDEIADNAKTTATDLLKKIPQLLLAALALLFAHWLSRFVGNRLHLLKIRSQNPYMSGLVRMVVRSAIMLVGVLIALDLIGWTSVVGAVLGSAGVVGLVLGFAFRDIAENYIAGILLSVRRPFEPGDHVVIENREGKVISVNSRTTVLMTMDGNHLQLPNSLVFKSIVLNYSKNPRRRFDFGMLIDPNHSIRVSQTLAMSAIGQIEGVLDDPAPSWTVVEYGAAGIQLRFYGWVDQRTTDIGKVRSEAIRRTKAAFADAGIAAPRTVYHIVTSRQRDTDEIEAMTEPMNHGVLDTSVNREIDVQVVEARADDSNRNLLESETKP